MSGGLDWARVKTVFHSALEQPDDLRASFVAATCGSDGALRDEVESLLIAHDAAGGFASEDALASLTTASLNELSANDSEWGPGARVGSYDIVGLVGRGSMGQIFKAHDSRLGRAVALKVLSPDLIPDPASRARFDREARTIASLNHPHICTIFDVGQSGRFQYLVMEYLEGETLREILGRGPLTVDVTRRYTAEMIDALETAHRCGVVHRDLKPANIIITGTGTKLLDFGVAKMIAENGARLAPADSIDDTRRRLGDRDRRLHEPGAGAWSDDRQESRYLGVRLRPVRDAERSIGVYPRYCRRHLRGGARARTRVEPVADHDSPVARPTDAPVLAEGSLPAFARYRRCARDIEDLDAGAAESQPIARRSLRARALPWVIAAGVIGLLAIVLTQLGRGGIAPSPMRLSVVTDRRHSVGSIRYIRRPAIRVVARRQADCPRTGRRHDPGSSTVGPGSRLDERQNSWLGPTTRAGRSGRPMERPSGSSPIAS